MHKFESDDPVELYKTENINQSLLPAQCGLGKGKNGQSEQKKHEVA